NSILGHFGTAPRFCEPWIASDIIKQHLESPAMWAVFLFQDLMAIDGNLRSNDISKERINNPSNPDHYWNYRMHLPLERLLHNTDFNQKMLELIKRSGR
ncbi:MAG TPA: 4-alpha-glucanotransferase, partial [Ferruginibacter sp.]|nr:4-alpha-glucanotransferase [Ferruginibacter sp.]